MNNKLKILSELVAKANDSFTDHHTDINTLMGIMDKSLRKQGLPADAITIDCVAVDKKIVILLHDAKPDVVDIALGNKDGDVFSSSEQPLSDISEAFIVDVMKQNFVQP